MRIDAETITNQITTFISQNIEAHRRDGAILGMSGGIDSSVVAQLLVSALSADRVQALLLPERDSSPDSKTDAMLEIERLGISYREVDLTPILDTIGIYDQIPLKYLGTRRIKESIVRQQHQKQAESIGEMPFLAGLLGTRDLGNHQEVIDSGNAYARIKHRLRMMILYYYAELKNLLVVGTTNRSEAMTGFVVKWGDNVADIEPILPLYKTQVNQLADYLGVDQRILTKEPSPDLIPGIVDELALGIDYGTLDAILWGFDQGWDDGKIIARSSVDESQIAHVRELVRRSAHTRELPPYPYIWFQPS
ncbi:MAG: NAD(+) synthase [Chloroflexota bacterium]|nr:NAD(+) synthase [Chloroflexota bacterium]